LFCLFHDPAQWNAGKGVVWISSTNVSVHSGKPNLRNLSLRNAAFIPQNRMKCGAFVIKRERMTCALNLGPKFAIRKFKWPEVLVDTPSHFIDWKSISRDRVPKPQKADSRDWYIFRLVVWLPAQKAAFDADEEVAHRP